ncbi:MAG: hypothetical protein FJY21_02130 [Bacteroidetes bacterium]|nr:hypothetical protein [Bacteroidota bacterium]
MRVFESNFCRNKGGAIRIFAT